MPILSYQTMQCDQYKLLNLFIESLPNTWASHLYCTNLSHTVSSKGIVSQEFGAISVFLKIG
jgi:hypothetical protein